MTTLSIPEPVTGPFPTPPSLLSASPAPSPVRLQGNLSHYHSLGPLSTLLSLTSRSLTYVFCFSWLAANIEPIPFQMYHPPNGPLVLLRILHSCLLKSLSNSLWTSHSTPSLSADDFMPCFALFNARERVPRTELSQLLFPDPTRLCRVPGFLTRPTTRVGYQPLWLSESS